MAEWNFPQVPAIPAKSQLSFSKSEQKDEFFSTYMLTYKYVYNLFSWHCGFHGKVINMFKQTVEAVIYFLCGETAEQNFTTGEKSFSAEPHFSPQSVTEPARTDRS